MPPYSGGFGLISLCEASTLYGSLASTHERTDMSYLNPPRLHFAGRFQAAPSTVNNDLTHFNNKTFLPKYQKMQTPTSPNGWWNPSGDADWRLIGCNVTAASLADGSPVDPGDPVLTYLVADSDRQVAAKLVDLDPEQQMASEIWGLDVRICNEAGETLLRGRYQPAAFIDIWSRAQGGGGGDMAFGAMYQSVLSDLEWGDVEQSLFLKELQAAAQDGLLSIKFNVDGYNMNFNSPEFTRGRVVGTIGPASADEPQHFTVGRQFMLPVPPNSSILNYFVAVVDPKRGKILLDLGNALPTTVPGGPLSDMGPLTLAYGLLPNNEQTSRVWYPIGEIPYTETGWYENTAGVVELPAGGTLSGEDLEAIAANPLALMVTTPVGLIPTMCEVPVYVRADKFVFRLDPGEQADARLFASHFGQPYAGAQVALAFDPSQLQGDPQAGWPDPGAPTSALQFEPMVTTGPDGTVVATIKASDPGNPRGYIDGQVYGVRPSLQETLVPNYPVNSANFISILVWDAFTPDEPPTWWGSLQPIFQQYANLYPVMGRFLDLADYDSVCDNLDMLRLAFGLNPDNPNLMPVTRDLSLSKRSTILTWLTRTGPDGKPLLGTQPQASEVAALEAVEPTASGVAGEAGPAAIQNHKAGGKAAAMSRRLALRSSGDNA